VLTRLKDFLTTPPVLTSPSAGETLLLYTATMLHTISAALVVERKEDGLILKVQRLVYFISEVLFDSKAQYPMIQKLLYTVLIAKCKLRHYFDAHPMVVVSPCSFGDIINNRESTSRIARWGLELMGLDIIYAPLHPDQVPSPRRLHSRMDQGAGLDRPRQGGVLDHVLRCLPHP
jgi:hypothetical protein